MPPVLPVVLPASQRPEQPHQEAVRRQVRSCVRGVISPLLANLFLHYVFDEWMRRSHPGVPFERYADDVVCHCRTLDEAQALKRPWKNG